MLEFIKQLALDAGEIIREAFYKSETTLEHKGEIDIVTETDLQCEALIVQRIQEKFPTEGIMTEEQAIINSDSNRMWIIDPLDGTTNFLHRFPFCAVSIGLEIDAEIKFGVVYSPILEELFYAEKDKGAFLNGKPIRVSETAEMSNALVATGFPYDRWQQADFYIREYLAFMKRCQGVRRTGAAAIDLCYVACGRLDGFFERKLKPWDMEAGSLIIKEAGGKITQFDGSSWHYSDQTILASNGIIHDEMVGILGETHD